METINLLLDNEDAYLPKRSTQGSAGYDIYSCEDKLILPKTVGMINTGIKIAISDPNMYAQIASRSGLASRGLFVEGGVIDSDYRGLIKVLLFNSTKDEFVVKKGDRIAQLIFHNIVTPKLKEVNSFSEEEKTERGENGFGSTG